MAGENSNTIPMIDPMGTVSYVPQNANIQGYLGLGYRIPTKEEFQHQFNLQQYGTPQQIAAGALEEGLSASTFGLSRLAEQALGVKDYKQRARQEVLRNEYPLLGMASAGAGLVGSSMLLPGGGSTGAMERMGATGAKALGFGQEGAGFASKVGEYATKMAIENMVFQSGDELGKAFMHTPGVNIQTAIPNIGLAGIIGLGAGGVMGAGVGALSPLWKATKESNLGGVLKAIKDKANGLQTIIPDNLEQAIQKTGLEITPEIRAGLSDNPHLQEIWKGLQESSSKAGVEQQNSLKNLKIQLSDELGKIFGKTPEEIENLKNISEHETGSEVIDKFHNSLKTKAEPIISKWNTIRNQFKDISIEPTLSEINQNLAEHANNYSYKGEPYEFVQKVMSQLNGNNVKNLEGLTRFQSDLWKEAENGKIDWRTAGQIVGIIRESETNAIFKAAEERARININEMMAKNAKNFQTTGEEGTLGHIKSEAQKIAEEEVINAQMQVDSIKQARADYGNLAKDLTELNEHLKLKKWKGPESFLEALKNSKEENLLKKLSKEDSVSLVKMLQNKYPEVANVIRQYKKNDFLRYFSKHTSEFETISPKKVFSEIHDMSPEYRDFLIGPKGFEQLQAIKHIYESIPSKGNTSGTAKYVQKMLGTGIGNAIAMATGFMGGGPLSMGAAKIIGDLVSKEAPDAIRVGLLKFLGSSEPINAGGFKAMIDFIHSTQKGENIIINGTKNLFKAGVPIVTAAMMPTQKDRDNLDKHLTYLQANPESVTNLVTDLGHYMPEQADQVGFMVGTTLNYLLSLKPNMQPQGMLDNSVPANPIAKSNYNRALDIAEQPMIVMQKMKDGTITEHDVVAIKTMYPDLYEKITQNIMTNLVDHHAKGQKLPYSTKMGISTFLGHPLDSSMYPHAILSSQNAISSHQIKNQNNMPQQLVKGSKALGKMPLSDATPQQARLMTRNK